MKKVILRSFALLILYTIIILFFAAFNWQIFIVKLNINLGFGTIEFPPFILLSLLSFGLIGIQSWVNYHNRLQKMIFELEHGMEIGKLKDNLSTNRLNNNLMDDKTIELLKEKLGLRKLEKTIEELEKKVSEIMAAEKSSHELDK